MKLFEFYDKKQPVFESAPFDKALALCESVIKMVENFDWEPQPEFKGAQGITTDTGVGHRTQQSAQATKQKAAMQKAWQTLSAMLQKTKGVSHPDALQKQKEIEAKLQKLRALAKSKGIDLGGETFGLAPN